MESAGDFRCDHIPLEFRERCATSQGGIWLKIRCDSVDIEHMFAIATMVRGGFVLTMYIPESDGTAFAKLVA